MRTRESNAQKRFAVDDYDLEDGNAADGRVAAEDDDEAFEDRDEPAASDGDASDSLASGLSGDDIADNEQPERRTLRRPPKPKAKLAGGKYLPLEKVSAEGPEKPYSGPMEKSHRQYALMKMFYGGRRGRAAMVDRMMSRWENAPLLPPKQTDIAFGQGDKFVWAPDWPEKEDYFVGKWLERMKEGGQGVVPWRTLQGEDAKPYCMLPKSMPLLCGPLESQQEAMMTPGKAYPTSGSGLPFIHDTVERPQAKGWMFDTGGIPISLSWQHTKDLGHPQLLAVAVVPFHDEEMYNYAKESTEPDFQKHGTVQLWEFKSDPASRAHGRYMAPKGEAPVLKKTICLEYGRAKRLLWSPCCNHLAILCGDGRVVVVEPSLSGQAGGFYKVDQPLANLQFQGEDDIKATAMTWVTFNRIAVGYSDGSIALWSLNPCIVISRRPVHHSTVMDMASGYPTLPYLLASIPIGGKHQLTDLQSPSYETSASENEIIYPHTNLLVYSDLLLGFLAPFPSRNPFTTIIGFMHHSQFPHYRRVFHGEARLTCLSVGTTHPHILVGVSDGSLWAMSSMNEIFGSRRESSDRIRIFQHEHRGKDLFGDGSPASQRGASRIVQGFGKVKNNDRRGEKGPPKKLKKPKYKTPKQKQLDALAGIEGEDNEDAGEFSDPTRGIIHDSLTRISDTKWNPNEGYGCWAAVAIGCGIVRVMDLGLEIKQDTNKVESEN